jgi:O-antigen/teichoic acid export membrane protein
MSEKNAFIKNSFFSYLTKFIPIIFSFAYTIVLANMLGVRDYGLFIYLGALVIGFLNLFGANLLNEILTNFIAQTGSKKLFKIIMLAEYVLTTIIFLGILIFGNGFITGLDGSNYLILGLAAVLVFFNPLTTTFMCLNKGIGKFDRIFVATTAENFVNLVFIIIFIWGFNMGLPGAFFSKYISLLASGLIYMFYLRKTVFKNKPIQKKEIKRYGMFGAIGEVLKRALSQFELIMIGIFISPAILGLYYVAEKIASIALGAPSGAFSDVLFPLNSANYKDKKKITKYSSLSVKVSFLIVFIFSIILSILAYPVLLVLFPAYVSALVFLPFLIILHYVKSFGAIKLILNSINKTDQRTLQRGLTVAFGATMLIILIPTYQVVGLIVANILMEIFAITIAYILLRKYNGIKISLVPRKADLIYFFGETRKVVTRIFAGIRN